MTMPAGATFLAPAGWSMAPIDGGFVMRPQAHDIETRVVELKADDAEAAANAAVASVLGKPAPRNPERHTYSPLTFGWQESARFLFSEPPPSNKLVAAYVKRHGSTWTVAVVVGDKGAIDKRKGQVWLPVDTLRGPRYADETFAGKERRPLDEDRVRQLTSFFERARLLAEVPGASLAIVEHGRVVFEGGFGTREIAKNEPVTADTPFRIGSITKSLTTVLLAKLVDKGRFGWETRVTDVDPSFRLADPAVTPLVRIKHLVCACTGLPQQDSELVFDFGGRPASSMYDLLAKIRPTTAFGESFQYSNVLAAVGGYVAAHAEHPAMEVGAAYDRAMQDEVFSPLGMNRTTLDETTALQKGAALPHVTNIDSAVVQDGVAWNRFVLRMRPGGGAWSTAHDLGRYVQLELGRGAFTNGTRVVSEENLTTRWRRQVTSGPHRSYGMGMEEDTSWGVRVLGHRGGVQGYLSSFFFLPDHDVGAVVLTNSDHGVLLTESFRRRLGEVLFDGKHEAEGEITSWVKARKESETKQRHGLAIPPSRATLAKLAPSYTNEALGTIEFRSAGETTILDVGEWRTPVATRIQEDGTACVVPLLYGFQGDCFQMATANGKRTLRIHDNQHEYVFVESP